MSTSPDSDFDFELHFLPAWAQEAPDPNRYAKYAGESKRDERKGDRFQPGRRRDDHGSRPRMGGGGGGGGGGGNRPQRRDGGNPNDRPGFGPRRGPDRGPMERRPPEVPLPQISVSFRPDEKGVESLAKQIRMTGRAYPLFEIAQMILRKPERHTVLFNVEKKPDGQPIQPLFSCALDDSLWLSEEEAVNYILDKFFSTFYQAERTQTEPPKGTYTFVAQCGLSGTILGPPNYHDYQNQLRKLHSEKFARMPFENFKARVKIVRDEAVVKKWIDDQSWRTEFICLNMPEPLKLPNREEVEKHFRETHAANVIKQVESAQLSGTASRSLQSPALGRLVRSAWEDQKRFPLQIATVLSQQFASHGLQFFKVNKTVTHVSVARPHFLDLEAAPVSDGIRRIVVCINNTPKCTRRVLIEALLPGQMPKEKSATPVAPAAPADPTAPAAAEPAEPSPEVTALVSDLHWLIHQGHVIEFATGILETAKRPPPRPEKPKQAPRPATPSAQASPTAESAPSTDPARAAEHEAGEVTGESGVSPSAVAEPDLVAVESRGAPAEPAVETVLPGMNAGTPSSETTQPTPS